MTRATRTAEYTGATALCLYLAFELGSHEWKLGFTTEPGAQPRVRTMPARDLARLTREIADAQQWFGLKATTPVRSCYEAGRDGFWLHRYVTSLGIANVVVDSSSIEVNRRLRRAKSDALDVRKLLGMLLRYHAGERAVWSVVRVPTVEEEDRRQLHRELRTLKQERTRVANRMNGLLANQGLWLPPGTNIGAAPWRTEYDVITTLHQNWTLFTAAMDGLDFTQRAQGVDQGEFSHIALFIQPLTVRLRPWAPTALPAS